MQPSIFKQVQHVQQDYMRFGASFVIKTFLALIMVLSAWYVIAISYARSAFALTPIITVSDDSFAPEGYSWRFEFQDVVSESGFEYIDDIAPYYSHINYSDPASGFFDCVTAGDAGYAAFIDGSTLPTRYGSPQFALRFTGGSYKGQAIDAILSIVDWTYVEARGGWSSYWMINDPDHFFESFRTGIFYNTSYTNDSRYRGLSEQPSLSNINLYLVGLSDVSIEIEFVEAGTNNPISVQGHATAIDIDCEQGLSFGSGIDSVEIAERSLDLSPDSVPFLAPNLLLGTVTAGSYAVSATDDDGYYNRALVGMYFTTDINTPYALSFHSPWTGENNGWQNPSTTAISFFALTPEYIANPSVIDIGSVAKITSAQDSIEVGEIFTFSLEVTVPVEGYTCRIGYRYQNLEFIDVLNKHLSLIDGSERFFIDGVEQANLPADVAYLDGSGEMHIRFDADYLSDMELNGQTLTVSFDVYAHGRPAPDASDRSVIVNTASVIINGEELETNTVYVEIIDKEIPTKTVTVTKRIAADELYRQHGDPDFIMILTGTDEAGVQHTYHRLVTFAEDAAPAADGYLYTSVVFEDVPVGVYELSEQDALRYKLVYIETNGMIQGASVTFDLGVLETAWATLTNEKTSVYGGSDATSVINWFTVSSEAA